MKKRIVSAVMSAVLVAGLLAGCGSKQESWKVTCPWAPSGVAAMVSQKAAETSTNTYSENIIAGGRGDQGRCGHGKHLGGRDTKANDHRVSVRG